MSGEAEAWTALTRGLEALAERVQRDDFPTDKAGRAETFRHLAQQTRCWLDWSMGFGDAGDPWFQRQNDLVTPWGGPNADNVYRHARIDPRHEYRITGNMHGSEDFALAIRTGFRHTDNPATLTERTGSDLGARRGEPFEVLLGGDGDEPNRIPLGEGAIMCSIREYYFDWAPLEPATFTIERIDAAPPVPPLSVADALAEALDLTERSMVFWNDYMIAAAAKQEWNSFGGKIDVPRGLQLSQFGFCFHDLGPDEALVIEGDVPDARYWSLQLYGMHFFRGLDLVPPTSLNHTQVAVDPDGRLRVVVAHRDPGVANWLDTTGRHVGLVNYRHFWGSRLATFDTKVVPVDELDSVLPDDTPRLDEAGRRAQLAARRAHLALRFRS